MFTSEQFANLPIQELEYHKFVLTADWKIAVRVLWGSAGDMLKSENLAGLTDYAIARSNLEVCSSDEIGTLLTGYALTGHNHDGVYSPVGHTHAWVYEPVFSKNTGFNKNFGTAAGTVLEWNRDALYEKLANKGQANGYAPLDSGSLIPSMYLPSYVDDVIDVALYASLPVTGESGKVYNVYGDTVSLNGSYRWGGAAYSKISSVSDAVWGHITGTLADQADLVSALAGKAAASHTHVLADLPNISQNHFLGRNSTWSGTIEVLSATQTRSALSVYSISDVDGFTVKLSGNQTINWQKIFEGQVYIRWGLFAQGNATGQTTWSDIASFKMHNNFNGAIWSVRNKADTNLWFEYYNGASWSEAMTLSSGGNLWVWTTSALGEKINVYHTSWSYIKFLNQFSTSWFRVGNEENIWGYIDMLDNKPIILRTNSIQRLFISENWLTEVRWILKVTWDGGGWSTQRLLFGGDGSGWQLKIWSINNAWTINATAITIWDNGSLQAAAILKSTSYYMNIWWQDRFSINEFDSWSWSRRVSFSCYDQNWNFLGNPVEFDNFANGEWTREMRFDANGWRMRFMNLPTSSAWLPSGALWRNGTVVNIVA